MSSETEAYEKAQLVLDAIYDYMYAIELHINVKKSCYMQFRWEYSNKERLVCARTDRTYDNLLSLKLCNKKLKRSQKSNSSELLLMKNGSGRIILIIYNRN